MQHCLLAVSSLAALAASDFLGRPGPMDVSLATSLTKKCKKKHERMCAGMDSCQFIDAGKFCFHQCTRGDKTFWCNDECKGSGKCAGFAPEPKQTPEPETSPEPKPQPTQEPSATLPLSPSQQQTPEPQATEPKPQPTPEPETSPEPKPQPTHEPSTTLPLSTVGPDREDVQTHGSWKAPVNAILTCALAGGCFAAAWCFVGKAWWAKRRQTEQAKILKDWQDDSMTSAERAAWRNEQIDSLTGAKRAKEQPQRRTLSSALRAVGAALDVAQDAVQASSRVNGMAQPAGGQVTVVVKASGDQDFVWDFEHTLSLTEPLRLTVQAWSYTYKVPESCVALETPQGQVLDLERSVWELGWKRDALVVLHAVPVDNDYAHPNQSQMGTQLSCRSFRTGMMSVPLGSTRSVPTGSFACPIAPPMGSGTASRLDRLALDPARVVVALHAQLDDGSRLHKMKLPLDMTSPLSTIAAIWAASTGLPAHCVGLETLDGEVVPLTRTPMDMGWQAGTAAELLAVPMDESYQGTAQKSFRCPQP